MCHCMQRIISQEIVLVQLSKTDGSIDKDFTEKLSLAEEFD